MTLKDDDHLAARYIKDLERRISDLEEQLSSDTLPSLLIKVTEQIQIDDDVSVRRSGMDTMKWNDDSTGWKTDTWGQYDRK